MSRIIPVPFIWQAWLWIAVTAVYLTSNNLVARRMIRKPGLTSLNNRAVAAVWQGLGLALLSAFGAALIIATVFKTPIIFCIFPSLVLAVYGMAWWLTAAMSGTKWIRSISLGCFTVSILIVFLLSSPNLFLAYAAALFLLVALPGWLLMRAEPSDIV